MRWLGVVFSLFFFLENLRSFVFFSIFISVQIGENGSFVGELVVRV